MSSRRHERPIRRVNPSAKVVWVARYTDATGKRRSAGTFALQRLAQDAIDQAYDLPTGAAETVGAYLPTWLAQHPRAQRTNDTNEHRIRRVLDVDVEGIPLRHWPLRDLRRRHAHRLVDVMLRDQARAVTGAVNILRALSAMCEDAIGDEIADSNPFKGVRVAASDPRATKPSRTVPVFTFEQMHAFAAKAGPHEAMLRVMSDCGLRLGEVLGLERRDLQGDTITVRGSAHEGRFTPGDQPTKRHVRTVPIPPSLGALLGRLPVRIDTPLLFSTPSGCMWRESNWRRTVWNPVRDLVDDDEQLVFPGMQTATPHAFRHSWETHLHAAGIDQADLAAIAGHTIATMHARYVHPLNQSHGAVREAIG